MSRYKRHRLSKLDLLEYALSGAVTERGLQSGNMSDSEEEQLDADIAEIEKRIKLVKYAQARAAGPEPVASTLVGDFAIACVYGPEAERIRLGNEIAAALAVPQAQQPQPAAQSRTIREIICYIRENDLGSIGDEWVAALQAPQAQQPLTDNEAFACADGLFPRWREDIQPAFVLLLSRAIERAHGIRMKP